MIDYSEISKLLAQSGAIAECESVVAYPDSEAWSVGLDGDTTLELFLDQRLGLIHVSSDVAPCPEGANDRLFRTLLQYNEQWLTTGGVRFGLDGERQQLTLTVSFSGAGLDAEAMADRLRRLGQIIEDWRSLLSDSDVPDIAEIAPGCDDVVLKL